MKICIIIGTRPEAIKLAPVILECRKHPETSTVVWLTGQQEMARTALLSFKIKDDLDLCIGNDSLSKFTGLALKLSAEYLGSYKPDLVIVQGDTSSTLAGALAAFYHKIPVAHVEAGLRTWNKHSPFPEEMNRQLISQLADIHFCPTEANAANIPLTSKDNCVHVVGNTIVDAVTIALKDHVTSVPHNPFVIVTAHRRESFGEGIKNICKAVTTLAQKHPALTFIFQVHPNPVVSRSVQDNLRKIPNIKLVEPMEYFDFIAHLNAAKFVMTDSGGIQEECVTLRKRMIIMREVTERNEAVDCGLGILTGTSVEHIVESANRYISDKTSPNGGTFENPFGDGQSAKHIVDLCIEYLKK